MKKLFASFISASLWLSGAVHAAPVTVTAGSTQTATLVEAATGRQLTLSIPSGGMSHLALSNGTGVMDGVPTSNALGAVGLVMFGKTTFAGSRGAVVNVKTGPVGRPSRIQPINISINTNVESMVLDTTTTRIVSIKSTGAFTSTTPYVDGLVDGGKTNLSNIRFDLQNRQVIADVAAAQEIFNEDGTTSLGPTQKKFGIVVWTFDAPEGFTHFPVTILSRGVIAEIQNAGYEVSPDGKGGYIFSNRIILPNLKLTQEAFELLAYGFGAIPGGTFYSTMQNVNNVLSAWGGVALTVRFSTSVPPINCIP